LHIIHFKKRIRCWRRRIESSFYLPCCFWYPASRIMVSSEIREKGERRAEQSRQLAGECFLYLWKSLYPVWFYEFTSSWGTFRLCYVYAVVKKY